MEILRAPGGDSYYSRGLRERYRIDATKLSVPQPIIHEEADIGYEVDESKYRARVKRRLRAGGLETEVPYGWPLKLEGELVWASGSFVEEDYVYHLTAADIVEINEALRYFKSLKLDSEYVARDNFRLPNLGKTLDAICSRIYDGCGFAIVRGLNPDAYSSVDFTIVYLGVSSYVGENRGKQDQRGTMLIHVLRRNQENHDGLYCMDKPFHTDTVADCLCLVTKSCSKAGGASILASSWTVYNELAETRPDLLHILAKNDWPFDTYGRSPPYYTRALMYYYHGKLITSFSRRLLVGHEPFDPRTKGIPNLNEAQAEALDAIHFISKKHELQTTMVKGDIRFINNMAIMHRREAFEDKGNENRHLIRLWLNNEMTCWKLPQPLRIAWARVFEDDEREAHWDIDPIRERNGTISRVAGSCD